VPSIPGWALCTPEDEWAPDEGRESHCKANRRARLKFDVEAQHRPCQSVCKGQPVSRRVESVRLVAVRNVNWQRGGDLAYPSEAACDRMLS
jgi:hypothetical protein